MKLEDWELAEEVMEAYENGHMRLAIVDMYDNHPIVNIRYDKCEYLFEHSYYFNEHRCARISPLEDSWLRPTQLNFVFPTIIGLWLKEQK